MGATLIFVIEFSLLPVCSGRKHFAGPDTSRENADCSPTVGRIGKPRPDMDRGLRNREFKAQFSFLAQLWQE